MNVRLKRRLDGWVAAELISAEQAGRILAHEERGGRRPWAVYGIALVGIVALLTGIVSLIAANWEDIPAAVKLLVYFALHGFVAVTAYRTSDRPGFVREVSLTLFALLFLPGIGLTAQIFHLHSDGWQGLLFWLALALPATLLCERMAASHIWIMGALGTAAVWVDADRSRSLWLFQDDLFRVVCLAALPPLLAAIGLSAPSLRRVPRLFARSARFWGLSVITLGGSFAVELAWRQGSPPFEPKQAAFLALPWALLIACMIAIARLPDVSRRFRRTAIASFAIVPAYLTLALLSPWPRDAEALQRLLGSLGFLLVWAAVAACAAQANLKRLFDLATLLIAIRFIVVYFEVFGSLTTTGIGLVIAGAIILSVAYVWHRYRSHAAAWLGVMR